MPAATPTARQLARDLRAAFRHGDLGDRTVLKYALSWMNRRDAKEAHRLLAQAFHSLPPASPGQISEGEIAPARSSDYCQGASAGSLRVLYFCRAPTADFSAFPAGRRLSVFLIPGFLKSIERATSRRFSPPEILWLSDLDGQAESAIADLGPVEIVKKLGLVGKELSPGKRVLIYHYQVGGAYKPTVLDARFAYYWAVCPEYRDYGWTRCLEKAEPGYKEWVARPADLELVSLTILNPADFSAKEDKLPDSYWQGCRKLVETARAEVKLS